MKGMTGTMGMKATKALTLALLAMSLVSVRGYALQSLPDFARQERARREANPVESIRVYTNENLPRGPRPGPGDAVQVTGTPAPADSVPTEEATDARPGSTPVTEDEWRSAFAEIRQEIERAGNALRLLELQRSELNREFLTRDDIYNKEGQLRPIIEAKEAELDAGQARLAAATEALRDLQEQLRRSGKPAGWGRP